MTYSSERKEQILKQMLAPQAPSISSLAKETGIASSTLWRWRHKLLPGGSLMSHDSKTAQHKAQLVFESLSLTDEQLGPFLRLHGICQADLVAWKAQMAQSLETAAPSAAASNKELRELKAKTKSLERELQRKEKALAEAAALLILQKKVQAIWGDEGNNT